jgi:hypothetical protein
MGQYGNQPDFGTRARMIVPTGDAFPSNNNPGDNLNSAALYIGTGGDLMVDVVGGNGEYTYTLFKNIPNGTFIPVIVNHVYSSLDGDPGTTCSDIIALY